MIHRLLPAFVAWRLTLVDNLGDHLECIQLNVLVIFLIVNFLKSLLSQVTTTPFTFVQLIHHSIVQAQTLLAFLLALDSIEIKDTVDANNHDLHASKETNRHRHI